MNAGSFFFNQGTNPVHLLSSGHRRQISDTIVLCSELGAMVSEVAQNESLPAYSHYHLTVPALCHCCYSNYCYCSESQALPLCWDFSDRLVKEKSEGVIGRGFSCCGRGKGIMASFSWFYPSLLHCLGDFWWVIVFPFVVRVLIAVRFTL